MRAPSEERLVRTALLSLSVILSEVAGSRSEPATESKDPVFVRGITDDLRNSHGEGSTTHSTGEFPAAP